MACTRVIHPLVKMALKLTAAERSATNLCAGAIGGAYMAHTRTEPLRDTHIIIISQTKEAVRAPRLYLFCRRKRKRKGRASSHRGRGAEGKEAGKGRGTQKRTWRQGSVGSRKEDPPSTEHTGCIRCLGKH